MPDVKLRLDLRTSGGEVSDIVWNGRYAGVLQLVYRENDRMMGTVQLNEPLLSASGKQEVIEAVHRYIDRASRALNVGEYEVQVSCGEVEHMIEGGDWAFDSDYTDETDQTDETAFPEYQLLLIEDQEVGYEEGDVDGEDQSYDIAYHLLDAYDELVAEVFCRVQGREVQGTVEWVFDPQELEIDAALDTLVADFDEDEIDVFVWESTFLGELRDKIELTHKNVRDEASYDEDISYADDARRGAFKDPYADEHTIVLAHDEDDLLTYEIYQQSHGGIPIGTATVDISEAQLTGFIDFREKLSAQERNHITQLLMEELDKEKDYETLHVSMLVDNAFIDELLLETEYVH